MSTGLTLKTFAKHLTGEGFSMFPVVYWAEASEPAGTVCVWCVVCMYPIFLASFCTVYLFFLSFNSTSTVDVK